MTTEVLAGRYRLLREIARSNDVVYEAEDTTLGRRVAVKELLVPPNLTGLAHRERVERFRREARAAGRLSHPNIVTIYEFGEDRGRYYIAMEFLEGVTLLDRLQTAGALPVREAVDIACQVLDGLAYAHAHHVIHRDIKPENIHILPGGQVKITDFGIARLTEEASLTGDGQVFGTPSYMSPEQIRGGAIDHRSDLFSLAVVLYEMLAGRKPFTGDSVISITYAIMNADPPPIAGISTALEQVVRRGLAKDPAYRYPSAEAMAQAIREAAAAEVAGIYPLAGASPALPPVYGAAGRAPSPWQAANPAPGVGVAVGPPPTTVPGGYVPSSTAAQAAPPPAVQPGDQPVHGPFATWGPTPTSAPPSVSGFATGPGGRAWSPLEGLRTFVTIMFTSFMIAGMILGGVLLFMRSYEEHQRVGRVMALRSRLQEAQTLAERGEALAAARVYADVLRRSPASEEGRTARTNLAEVWNRLGTDAARMGEYARAATYFQSVLDLYQQYPDGLTGADESRIHTARENLAAIAYRLAEPDGRRALSGRDQIRGEANYIDPGAQVQQARQEVARRLLEEGNRAMDWGNVQLARDLWSQAAEAAPGSPPSQEALRRLEETTPPPSFGGIP